MINHYLKLGRGLTPLVPGDRRPLFNEWPKKPFFEIPEKFKNHRFGWVIGDHDLVIDVDPRNGGDREFLPLAQEFFKREGRKLIETYPVVRTPRGGVHIYASLEKPITPTSEYDGIDVLTMGKQVVIAGMKYDHGEYSFDPRSPWQKKAPTFPGWFLEYFIAKQGHTKKASGSTLTRSQVRGLLDQLDPQDYGTNDRWLPIMQACHEASGGGALAEFIEWSISDPKYANDTRLIETRWNSHEPGKVGNVTAGTLINEVLLIGGHVPTPSPDELIEDVPDLPADFPKTIGEVIRDGRELQKCPLEFIVAQIADLQKDTPLAGLKKILAEIAKHPKADAERLLKQLAKRTDHRVADLREAIYVERLKKTEKAVSDDPGVGVASITLAEQFAAEDRVVHAADQQYWYYTGTHWAVLFRNMIRQKLNIAAEKWQARTPESGYTRATLISQGDAVLSAQLAKAVVLHDAAKALDHTVVNVLNGELHLSRAGAVEFRKHDPASWQTSVLPVKYLPESKCRLFDKYLNDVFRGDDTLTSHVWELIGYTLQRHKDIAAWVFLSGTGENGKSVLLHVLQNLLGDAALCSPLDEIAGDKHGTSRLPGKLALIDDDIKKGYALPDSFLKKISENKKISARPLHAPNIEFENTAIVWMAGNELPRSNDVSIGMIRRANVIPFTRQFKKREQNLRLKYDIVENELSGVLNKALAGLQRLRHRGYFDAPDVADDAKDHWRMLASPVSLWIKSATITNVKTSVTFRDAYLHYSLWVVEQGMARNLSKPGFRKALESAGMDIRPGGANVLKIFGVELKKVEDD